MKTENILTIEESGENRINLVRDRLFWQAWNRSAFLFAFFNDCRLHNGSSESVSPLLKVIENIGVKLIYI